MLKYIIILLNIALVFQYSCTPGKETNPRERVKGGFRECRVYEHPAKNGVIDTNKKRFLSLIRYDYEGFKIEQYYNFIDLTNFYERKSTGIIGIYFLSERRICYSESKYDEYGNLIEEIESDGNRKPIYCYKYIYSK